MYLAALFSAQRFTSCDVCPGCLRNRHQDGIKCGRNLLGEMLVRENGEGDKKGWKRHQTIMQV